MMEAEVEGIDRISSQSVALLFNVVALVDYEVRIENIYKFCSKAVMKFGGGWAGQICTSSVLI